MNLEAIFKGEWKPISPYKRKDNPTRGYANIVFDPFRDRVLMYVEAIDPKHTKEVGWQLPNFTFSAVTAKALSLLNIITENYARNYHIEYT